MSVQVSGGVRVNSEFELLGFYCIWLCPTMTDDYQIHEFDWLKSIKTAV